MIKVVEFKDENEMNKIINSNKDLFLIEFRYWESGNFLVFSDYPTNDMLLDEHNNKISILEAENEKLKQELSITQDAVNELIFNSLNM